MDREFKKISFITFKKDICNDKILYDEYKMPERSTKFSAGYDFFAINDISIKPNEIVKIPTGIRARMQENEVLFIIIRSSMAIKNNLRLINQVGVIDADYYENPDNEGHIYICMQNVGCDIVNISKNKAFAQGIFMNYSTCGEKSNKERKGGIGSTTIGE